MNDFYHASVPEQLQRLDSLAREALKHWDVTDCEPQLLKYRENAVYRVRTPAGRSAALRLHRYGYHSNAELASELSWMAALAADGIAVPSVIPAMNGAPFVTVSVPGIPEPRQADMLEWLEGEPFGSLETGLNRSISDVRTAFEWVGRLAARMHNHAANWKPPAGFTRHAWDTEGLIGERPLWGRFWELPSLTAADRQLLQHARSRAREDLANSGPDLGCYGLIHADMLTDNIILGSGHVKVLDFDDCGFGWHLFDFATILLFLHNEENYNDIFGGLVKGYRSVRPPPDEQLAHMPLFFLLRSFTYLGWAHTRFETPAAQELAPMLTEVACRNADLYLSKT